MDRQASEQSASRPGVAIEGALAIRSELDRVDLGRSSLYVEEGYHAAARLVDDYLPGELPAEGGAPDVEGDDLVEEIVERVRDGHGRVVHVPDGTLVDAGVVLVVDDDGTEAP
jgi:hypothetical protein